MANPDMDNKLDAFIKIERAIEPNPFISTRVMGKITGLALAKNKKQSAYKIALVAVSILIAIIVGMAIGDTYQMNENNGIAVMINDNQIENLGFYKTISNE